MPIQNLIFKKPQQRWVCFQYCSLCTWYVSSGRLYPVRPNNIRLICLNVYSAQRPIRPFSNMPLCPIVDCIYNHSELYSTQILIFWRCSLVLIVTLYCDGLHYSVVLMTNDAQLANFIWNCAKQNTNLTVIAFVLCRWQVVHSRRSGGCFGVIVYGYLVRPAIITMCVIKMASERREDTTITDAVDLGSNREHSTNHIEREKSTRQAAGLM